jgi:hypothetical protein
MAKLIDEAVAVLRNLPDDVAAAAARAIIEYGAQQDDDLLLSDAQAEEIERRIGQPDRALLSIDDVRDRLHRFGV